MRLGSVAGIFLALLVVLILPFATPAHAVTYIPGVRVGDWARYNVELIEQGNMTLLAYLLPAFEVFRNVDYRMLNITQVTGTIVTYANAFYYINGTATHTNATTDVTATLGGEPIIAGGLSEGDHLSAVPLSSNLNATRSVTILGFTRTLNFVNITNSYSYGGTSASLRTDYVYDRTSGIAVEIFFSEMISISATDTAEISFHVSITDTNILTSSEPPPDFRLFSSTTSLTANSGATIITTITISPVNGFAGTVTLTADTPQGVTCTFDHNKITTSESARLSCTASSAGAYMITITGKGWGKTNKLTEPLNAGPPPQSMVTLLRIEPGLLYTLIGVAVAMLAGVVAVVVAKSRQSRATTPEAAPQPPQPTS